MASCWEFVVSAMLMILIVRNQKAVAYYLKFGYYWIAVNIVVAVLIPVFAMRPRNVLNFLISSRTLKHVSNVIGIKWTLRNPEHLTKDQTCVIIANHQSCLDVQGMMDIWPVIRKMTAIAKREILLYSGTFGISMFLAGLAYIDRKAGVTARQAMNDTMDDLKEKKIKLWVFAEGTRRNTGEIHEFKKGAFHAAVHSQVPIVPVVFSSYKNFLDAKRRVFDNGEIIITALPEISTEGLTAADVDGLIMRTRNAMIEVYKTTSKETEMNSAKAKAE